MQIIDDKTVVVTTSNDLKDALSLDNGYLYIKGCNFYIENVVIHGVFQDPEEVEKFNNPNYTLDDYYKDIVEIFDRLIESSQGLTQSLEDIKIPVSSKVDSPIDYLKSLDAFIERNKKGLRSFQIAILDDAQELINETIYKLKFLK